MKTLNFSQNSVLSAEFWGKSEFDEKIFIRFFQFIYLLRYIKQADRKQSGEKTGNYNTNFWTLLRLHLNQNQLRASFLWNSANASNECQLLIDRQLFRVQSRIHFPMWLHDSN